MQATIYIAWPRFTETYRSRKKSVLAYHRRWQRESRSDAAPRRRRAGLAGCDYSELWRLRIVDARLVAGTDRHRKVTKSLNGRLNERR